MFIFRLIALLSSCVLISPLAFAGGAPSIEIVPLAIWQGKPNGYLRLSLLDDLRSSFPDSRIAHAISAAPLARGETSKQSFIQQLSALTRPGDDLLLHMAPWKSLADKSSIPVKYGPTLFGVQISEGDCANDCGLDTSISSYSDSEIRKMISLSRKMLVENSLGTPAAVYFDEGVTSDTLRKAARQEGILQDWSGIEMAQMKSYLGRFPVYRLNKEGTAHLPLGDLDKDQVDGLFMDHVRYGVHAEIADMDSTIKVIHEAIDHAKKVNRVVRIPVVFNIDDLYYTHEFVRDAVLKARELAKEGGVEVVSWVPQNLTWDLGKVTTPAPAMPIAMNEPAAPLAESEPEFIPLDEAELDKALEMDAIAH